MKESYCGVRRFAIQPRSGHLKSIQHNGESTMKAERQKLPHESNTIY